MDQHLEELLAESKHLLVLCLLVCIISAMSSRLLVDKLLIRSLAVEEGLVLLVLGGVGGDLLGVSGDILELWLFG